MKQKRAIKIGAAGFTLIEVLVSLALFVSVMTVAGGAILSIIDANRKAQATNTAIDNLNFVLDNMTRNLRTGTGWTLPDTNSITFTAQPSNVQTTYLYNAGALWVVSGVKSPQRLLDSKITIDQLAFVQETNTLQPYVHIIIKAHMGYGASKKYDSEVVVSTSVSQRSLKRP